MVCLSLSDLPFQRIRQSDYASGMRTNYCISVAPLMARKFELQKEGSIFCYSATRLSLSAGIKQRMRPTKLMCNAKKKMNMPCGRPPKDAPYHRRLESMLRRRQAHLDEPAAKLRSLRQHAVKEEGVHRPQKTTHAPKMPMSRWRRLGFSTQPFAALQDHITKKISSSERNITGAVRLTMSSGFTPATPATRMRPPASGEESRPKWPDIIAK